MDKGKTNDRTRIWTYIATTISLMVLYAVFQKVYWPHSGTEFHTLMEVVATLLAFLVGVISFVRYYAQPHNTILLIGAGFFGAALLDGYHALVTASFFSSWFLADSPSLWPWSWNTSRTFLALLMFLSWLACWREQKLGEAGKLSDRAIYLIVAVMALANFIFFTFMPLGPAYFPELIFGRPQELIPAVFFLVALIGYLSKQQWRTDAFEHWLIISLIVGFFDQALFMSRSYAIFDEMFGLAHLLKILSYCLVLSGLLADVHTTWSRERELANALHGANQTLQHRNEALKQSNLQLQQFAYIASHDLQTPLRAISGFTQILQSDYQGKLDDKADRYIERIVRGATRMQTLINDLLTYSRIESRSAPFRPTNLNEIFDDALGLLHTSIEDTGGKVTRDQLPMVIGDRAQLCQLLYNLIGNGIKYHGHEKPRVHVSAEQNGRLWTIAVRDNGIGINPKHHEKIFEIFRRLHTAEQYPGTGIGLAVCHRIVQRHGGKIWLESEVGKGSVFYFTLTKATTNNNGPHRHWHEDEG